METFARSAIRSSLLLVLISAGTLFWRLGSLPFTGADEPRYARVAEEMWRAHRWVTPLLEGHPWLEKPPLYYWMTVPFYAAFGPSEATARLGVVACALMVSFAVLWFGRRLISPSAGLYAGMSLLSAAGFVGFGRSASTDMPFVACLTVALALLGFAVLVEKRSIVPLLGGYILLGCAVLAKGPVALLLAGGIMTLFWWLDRRGGSMRQLHIIPGILVAASVALPWFWLAFQENGFSFLAGFFINHNLARYVSEIHHHAEPVYYYVPVLLASFFPWSGWLGLLFGRAAPERSPSGGQSDRVTLFLVCWLVFPLLFFSLSRSKLPGYVLPCLPPAALLLGKRLGEPLARGSIRKASWFYAAVSITMATTVILMFQMRYGGRWGVGLVLALASVVPAPFAFRFARRGAMHHAALSTCVQGVVLMLAIVHFAFPALAAYHSARDIARQAIALRQGREPLVTYRFFHHALNYYANYQISAHLPDAGSLQRFAGANPGFLVVTEFPRLEELATFQELSVIPMSEQGKLRLVRIARR